MPAWLTETLSTPQGYPSSVVAWRIVSALLLGAAVAGIYRWARRGQGTQATFLTTLVILLVTIAMATQVIGESIARAFSLVGALSVARFRTVVKDTQDTAFVILAVVVGMAAGASNTTVALIGLGLLVVAAPLLWPPHRDPSLSGAEVRLKVRLNASQDVRAMVERVLASVAIRATLLEIETTRQGASIDLTYRVRPRPDIAPVDVATELTRTEGVEGVEMRRAD